MIEIPSDMPILVVDDSPADRMIVETVLDRSELENPVELCPGGEEALERMRLAASGAAPVPCLILMDVNMPRTSGFDVLREVRALESLPSLPIMWLISSSDAEDDRLRARELGGDGYLVKAMGVDNYVDLINRTFANAPAERRSAGV